MLHLTVLAFHEEAIREDTLVMEGTELPEVVAEGEAAQVDDATGGDEIAPLQIAVDVGRDERVLVRDPPGELALDAPVVRRGVVGNAGVESLGAGLTVFRPRGREKPEAVADDTPAQGSFVDAVG